MRTDSPGEVRTADVPVRRSRQLPIQGDGDPPAESTTAVSAVDLGGASDDAAVCGWVVGFPGSFSRVADRTARPHGITGSSRSPALPFRR